jgi:Carboxypeptidase regulatory-like domain
VEASVVFIIVNYLALDVIVRLLMDIAHLERAGFPHHEEPRPKPKTGEMTTAANAGGGEMFSKKDGFCWGLALFALMFLIPLGNQPGFAQVDMGTIVGAVTDQTGAVIPGAKVTLINSGTGFTLSTVTSRDGTYVFSPIRIGTYSITVEKQGFKRVTRPGLTVNVQAQVKVDVTLVPGAVRQTVEVRAATPLLQTQTASVGQTVGSQEVNNLPLNGRNYTFLAHLVGGVTRVPPTGRHLQGTGSFNANGLPMVHNDYILDGIDNNSVDSDDGDG